MPTTVTVEAQDTGAIDPTYTGTVTLDTGDAGDVVTPVSHTYDGGDAGTFDFSVTFHAAGPRTLTASDGVSTEATGGLTVDAGALDHIVVSPGTASVQAGVDQAYTVAAFDQYDNAIGDVTSSSTFTMTPDGGCDSPSATCNATLVGAHVVTAHYGGQTDTSTLTVTVGPVDHISVSPSSASKAVGVDQAYTVEAYDLYSNDIGDVTGSATYTIAPDGTCNDVASTCQATALGAHTVTANYSSKTDTSTLTVTVGPVDHITITPSTSSRQAGEDETYAVEGFDLADDDLGDVTGSSTFTITPDGTCNDLTATCHGTLVGDHTVTAHNNGATDTRRSRSRSVRSTTSSSRRPVRARPPASTRCTRSRRSTSTTTRSAT